MTKTTALTKMTADINVGINEVVSVFVAKYEDGLFAKKDEISKKIKAYKQELADLIKRLECSINREKYQTSIPILSLTSKVTEVDVVWEKTYRQPENTIVVNVGLFDADERKDCPSHTKTFTFPIEQSAVDCHKELNTQIENYNAELMEVMSLIKTVSRKERQIRGRISEMKLAESGYEDLINNTEILQLVQLS